MSNDHNLAVFDLGNGAQAFKMSGDKNYIYDCSFTQKPGEYTLMTSGKKHLFFWEFQKQEKRRGIAGKHGIISHQVCAWDSEGVAYSGAADGKIFVWKERECVQSKAAHKGYIQSIRALEGKLFTGGRDGKVMEHSTPDLKPGFCIDFNSMPCAIDYFGGSLLVGLRNGTIIHLESAE